MLQNVIKRKNKYLGVFTKALDKLNALGEEIKTKVQNNETDIKELADESANLDKELLSIKATAAKIKDIVQ